MANQTIMRPEFSHCDGGGAPKIVMIGPDTSATWSYGDILELNLSTGLANVAEAGDAILLGIALSANPFLTRTDVTEYPVLVFTRDTLIAINAWATNTVADAGNHLTQAMIGNAYDLAIAGAPNSAFYVCDIGATTDAIFIIEKAYGAGLGAVGDHYARVIVRPVIDALALAGF